MRPLPALRAKLASREDSEHEQALFRIGIVGLVLLYMAIFHGWRNNWTPTDIEIVQVLGGFLAIALGIFTSITVFPKPNVPRRLVGMLADTAGCTWYMWVAGEYGFFVIGIFLFITFGNGFRYGRRYLFGCQLLCIAGLTSVLLFVPFWEARRIAGVGLLIALIVLPLYVSILLKRIQEARAKAEEANTAKTTFLANMSHEIRTPLNGIVGVVDLFKTTELSVQQTELVQLLRHSVTVLRSLVDDVLDISKIESGRLSIEVASFDLYATINGLVQLLRPHAQSKGLVLHATVDPELDYRLRADSHHLRQILLNLLGNAIKFTQRGEITLAVALKKSSAEGVTARFEIKDTGIGIPADLLPRIFERFVQVDQSATRRFGGSGLGTTIAKQLVELMGGNIGVHSQIGQGTTFWFELPMLRDTAAELAKLPGPNSIDSIDRTILIADQAAAQLISPIIADAGEKIEVLAPSELIGARLDALIASGISIRAIVTSCRVDIACTAFASARQRIGDKPVALIFIAKEPLSIVDSARIKSIREACVLDSPATSRLIANAIHAAVANSSRENADAVDLPSLIKQKRVCLRILVADDNETNQRIISQLLSSAGHSVIVASDGEEALDLYERDCPDAALLDFNMPHRNGLEVVTAIRMMERPGTRMPAIILSASVTLEARERALQAGADDFVGKPFDAAALIAKIDGLADRLAPRVNARSSSSRSTQHKFSRLPGGIAEATAPEPGAIIDYQRLAELEDISRNSKFMTELLRGFKTDVEALLGRLGECVIQGNTAVIDDLLHALKGAAVGVGAPELSRRCDEFSAAKPRDAESIRRNVSEIRKSVQETVMQLDEYVRKQHKVSL